jgi:hypothetical protein
MTPMNEVTQILSGIEAGDPHAAEQLLPLVYDELRKLAAQKLAQEKPGQTLEATALVHEAYVDAPDPVVTRPRTFVSLAGHKKQRPRRAGPCCHNCAPLRS